MEASTIQVCPLCNYPSYTGGHFSHCALRDSSGGSYPELGSFYGYPSLNNLTAEGANRIMATSNPYSNNSVIEVVLITENAEGNQRVAFGPKAFLAGNAQAAVAKATGEFIEGGGDSDEVVNALTRFFG